MLQLGLRQWRYGNLGTDDFFKQKVTANCDYQMVRLLECYLWFPQPTILDYGCSSNLIFFGKIDRSTIGWFLGHGWTSNLWISIWFKNYGIPRASSPCMDNLAHFYATLQDNASYDTSGDRKHATKPRASRSSESWCNARNDETDATTMHNGNWDTTKHEANVSSFDCLVYWDNPDAALDKLSWGLLYRR